SAFCGKRLPQDAEKAYGFLGSAGKKQVEPFCEKSRILLLGQHFVDADREPEKVADAAEAAHNAGAHEQAIRLAEFVRERIPQRAWLIIGLAACDINKTAKAQEAFQHLEPSRKHLLMYPCFARGIKKLQ